MKEEGTILLVPSNFNYGKTYGFNNPRVGMHGDKCHLVQRPYWEIGLKFWPAPSARNKYEATATQGGPIAVNPREVSERVQSQIGRV